MCSKVSCSGTSPEIKTPQDNQDTSINRTLYAIPRMSILERYDHCRYHLPSGLVASCSLIDEQPEPMEAKEGNNDT